MDKSNFDKLYSDIFIGISDVKDEFPTNLYHYTDASALHGMLSKDEIWATDNRFMNDKTEFVHGINLFEKILRESEDSSNLTKSMMNVLNRLSGDSFSGILFHALRSLKQEYLDDDEEYDESIEDYSRELFNNKNSYYIVCFTEKNDDLSQWRGYGASGGGFSVGFKIDCDLVKCTNKELVRIIYDECEQIKLINILINNIHKIYDSYYKKELINKIVMLAIITYSVEKLCLRFKNESYKDEKEWRMIYVVRTLNNEFLVDEILNELMFRVRNDCIIQYIPIKFKELSSDKLNLINKLICGPSSNINFSVIALKQLKDKYKYSFSIAKSKIPFRST